MYAVRDWIATERDGAPYSQNSKLERSSSLAVKRLTSFSEGNVVKGPVQVLVIFAISSQTPRTETNLTEIEPYQENSAFWYSYFFLACEQALGGRGWGKTVGSPLHLLIHTVTTLDLRTCAASRLVIRICMCIAYLDIFIKSSSQLRKAPGDENNIEARLICTPSRLSCLWNTIKNDVIRSPVLRKEKRKQ